MSAESGLWEKIISTRNPRTEERQVSARLPFGILKRVEISWLTMGYGKGDAFYALGVIERRPQGRVAARLEPETSLTATLSKNTPPYEDYGSVRTIYKAHLAKAHLAASELITINSVAMEADDREGGDHHEPRFWIPDPMTPQEAIEGFESAMADAHFN